MKVSDNNEFYIRSSSHPSYEDTKIVEEELINVIIQKLEMIIFSSRGDLYGDQFFGSDLEYYLWSTRIPSSEIKKKVNNQILKYIPELMIMGYSLDVEIYEGSVKDILYLKYKIKDYNINFIID
jgi:hypothetical protein